MRWLAAVRAVPLVAYPFIIYLALGNVEAKYLGLALFVLFLFRSRKQVTMLTHGLERAGIMTVVTVGIFAAAVWWSNAEWLLRLYPALLSTIMLALFAFTLYRPPSMIERFARLRRKELPAEAILYTRRVTQVWCAFLVVNSSIAAYSALFMSREAWVLYTGFINYVLMGVLLVGEWLYRRYRYGAAAG